MNDKRNSQKGRGSALLPPNRFERIHFEDDFEQLEDEEILAGNGSKVPTEYFKSDAKTIITENNSPDISFRYSANPYSGCSHGCLYFTFPLSANLKKKCESPH